jgi:hypothetical protein
MALPESAAIWSLYGGTGCQVFTCPACTMPLTCHPRSRTAYIRSTGVETSARTKAPGLRVTLIDQGNW